MSISNSAKRTEAINKLLWHIEQAYITKDEAYDFLELFDEECNENSEEIAWHRLTKDLNQLVTTKVK